MAPSPPTPSDLTSRLDTILMTAESLLRSLPDNDPALVALDGKPRLPDLGFRIFRLGLAFIDAVDAGQLREGWLRESLPEDMQETRTLANYGALVRGRLAGWFEGTEAAAFTRTIDTPDGPLSAHDLLLRVTEQAALQLRELSAVAERDHRRADLARP